MIITYPQMSPPNAGKAKYFAEKLMFLDYKFVGIEKKV